MGGDKARFCMLAIFDHAFPGVDARKKRLYNRHPGSGKAVKNPLYGILTYELRDLTTLKSPCNDIN